MINIPVFNQLIIEYLYINEINLFKLIFDLPVKLLKEFKSFNLNVLYSDTLKIQVSKVFLILKLKEKDISNYIF